MQSPLEALLQRSHEERMAAFRWSGRTKARWAKRSTCRECSEPAIAKGLCRQHYDRICLERRKRVREQGMAQADKTPDLLAYGLERKEGNTWVVVTYRLRGNSVTSRRESDRDTFPAQLGKVDGALRKLVL